MVGNGLILDFLTFMLIIYFLAQITADAYTKMKSRASNTLQNHGINETEADAFTPGISNLIMFILWIAIIITRDLYLGTESSPYFRINYPVYLNEFLQIVGIILVFLGVISANWSGLLEGYIPQIGDSKNLPG